MGGAVIADMSGSCADCSTDTLPVGIRISSGHFRENFAADAGAGVYASQVRVGCDDCRWDSNLVGDSRVGCGAGLKLVNRALANVTRSSFHDNAAPNGAAVCVDNSAFNATAVGLLDNRAALDGGAIKVVGSRQTMLPGGVLMACRDCTLMGNSAANGGRKLSICVGHSLEADTGCDPLLIVLQGVQGVR